MSSRDYYRAVLQLLTASRVVTGQRIEFDEQDVSVAYLKGVIDLIDGSTLFLIRPLRRAGRESGQPFEISLPLAGSTGGNSLPLG